MQRLAAWTRLRLGRARTSKLRLIWHDTVAGSLARDGLALCERHTGRDTVWRLERLRSAPGAPFSPGQPAPLVAEAATLDALNLGAITPLVPVAACDAALRSFAPASTADGLRVRILTGTLRAVAGEQPVCRLLLAGAPGQIEALALALAQEVRLAVPPAALAAEALATAGREVAPRALGAPMLARSMTASDAFSAVAGHLTDVVLHWAPHAEAGVAPEPVHQMRVALRRLRSAQSLFRRALTTTTADAIRHDLRLLLNVLGPCRDWDVFVAGNGRAAAACLPDDRPLARLLAAAERKRQDSYSALREQLGSPAFRCLGLRLACLAAFRPWEALAEPAAPAPHAVPVLAYAAQALDRRWKRVLEAGDDIAALPPHELHALRIEGKRLRYAAEFFAPLFPGHGARRFLRRIATVQDRLGRLNDNTVAGQLMADLGGAGRSYASGLVRGFIAAGQRGAHSKMERAWKKFRRTDSFWH